MTRIGLISDTHGFLDEQVFAFFKNCNEIWHAGDFGSIEVANRLKDATVLNRGIFRGVYGNIDGPDIRSEYPETLFFKCEQVKVLITHIGGYPPKYNPVSRELLKKHHPKLFIAGHSHILRVIYDDKLECLHINPGAAGRQGIHDMRTTVRFVIDGSNIKDCEVIKLGKRGS